jgi:hypothetical protein
VIISRQQVDPINLIWLGHSFIHAHDGRFELPGLDPEKPAPVYFLDAGHPWGATVELPGRQAGEGVTIQLQPCGQAKARFVGPDGRPVARLDLWPSLELIMTPGPTGAMFVDRGQELSADAAFLANVDPQHYGVPRGPITDAEGRVTLPNLIPGALYRIIDWSTRNDQAQGPQVRRDFTVKPGETLDLGEILIEKPQP